MTIPEEQFEYYQGVLLDQHEYMIIKVIEGKRNTPIPLVRQIPVNDDGIVINNGHVIDISLYWTEIGDLPSDFGDLIHLRSLILRGCDLEKLPDTFFRLECLEYLDLSENLLTYLPESFANLSRLQHLDLAENQLTRLPDFWGHFSHLRHLDLEINPLEMLPPSIGQLKTLTKLRVGANSLTGLDFSFKGLQNLIELDMSANNLHDVPPDLDQLCNLAHLDLSENHLSGISIKGGQFIPLTFLNFEENDLSFIPPLATSGTLHRLNLGKNRLRTLGGIADFYPALEVLDLHTNQLENIGDFPRKLPKIHSINLHANRIERLQGLPFDLPSIETINISNNPLRTLAHVAMPILQAIFFDPTNYQNLALSLEGAELIATHDIDAIYQYYRRTPEDLAHSLANGDLLIPQEESRLVYEADYFELGILHRSLPNEHPVCTAIRQRIGDFPADLIQKIEADDPLTEEDLRHPILPRYVAFLEEHCRKRDTPTAKKSLEMLQSVILQLSINSRENDLRLLL
jgi:Leucine-rich repeat (LRR) protein